MEEFDKSSLYYVDSTPEGTRYSLYDTASWKNGLAFKNIDFSESGLPVIKIAELNNGISSSTTYTDKTYSQDVFLTKGDYVFSWSGNPETSIDIYKYNLPDGWLNQHIFKVTPKTEIIDKGFFFYLMKFLKPYFKKIATNKQTTGLGHVTISDLQRMSVALPPLPTQQKIAAILSSLDDKIELNNKINTNLEQQAGALFKNWFVDFEPFGGKMPEGWKVGKLSEIAEIKTDTFKPEQNPDIQVEHYSLPAFDEKRYLTFEISKELKSNKFIISNDEVLVSKLNPTVKRVWRLYCLTEKSICSTEFIVYKPISAELKDYLFSIVNSSEFNDFMCSNVTGSTNSHQRTPPKTTLNYEIPIPTKEILHKFCNIVTPMYDKIKENIKQNETVSSLRDTLLPKLMNGEIEV